MRRILASVALAFATGSTAYAAPPAPSAAELRQEKTAILDRLYADFIGKAATAERNRDAQTAPPTGNVAKDVGRDVKHGVGTTFNSAERASFATHCTTAGKGDKVTFADDRTKAFFARPDVRASCANVVRIDKDIKAQR